MPKPPGKSPERKLQVVLSVLRGEMSAADARPSAMRSCLRVAVLRGIRAARR